MPALYQMEFVTSSLPFPSMVQHPQGPCDVPRAGEGIALALRVSQRCCSPRSTTFLSGKAQQGIYSMATTLVPERLGAQIPLPILGYNRCQWELADALPSLGAAESQGWDPASCLCCSAPLLAELPAPGEVNPKWSSQDRLAIHNQSP